MFTGLVEAVGVVAVCRPAGAGVHLRIDAPFAAEMTSGESFAVNGVCLTAVGVAHGCLEADLGPETLRVTTLGRLREGQFVNLERPLKADGRVGGHFVLGHVDGIGHVEEMTSDGDATWVGVSFPESLAPYMILKGSIAIDGISLTVARLGEERLDVQIIPFTRLHTNLREARVGDAVNLECDMIGKYVVRAAALAGRPPAPERPARIS